MIIFNITMIIAFLDQPKSQFHQPFLHQRRPRPWPWLSGQRLRWPPVAVGALREPWPIKNSQFSHTPASQNASIYLVCPRKIAFEKARPSAKERQDAGAVFDERLLSDSLIFDLGGLQNLRFRANITINIGHEGLDVPWGVPFGAKSRMIRMLPNVHSSLCEKLPQFC